MMRSIALVLALLSICATAATNTLVTSSPPNQGLVAAKDTSAGAGDAAKVPLLNSLGYIDLTMFAPLSGDCATSGGSGVLTCTKTNGVAFATSATTDTTNATNITSGTLPNARIVALPNANLANSSITIAGHAVALGGTQAIACADLSDAGTGCSATSLPPNGSATGDLSGSYPAPTVAKVNGSTPGGTCTNQFVRSVNSSAVPTCASVVAADLPNPSASTLGGIESYAAVTHQWINAISTSGVPASTQPAASDLSNGTTGSNSVVLGTSPTIATPTISGAQTETTTPSHVISAVSSNSSAPAAGSLTTFVKKLAGRETPWSIGPSGIARSVEFPEASSFKNSWVSGPASAGTAWGWNVTLAGTAAQTLTTLTNKYTSMSRTTFASVVTTQNQQVGFRSGSNWFYRGNASGLGGFFFIARFGFTTIKTGERFLCGMSPTASNLVTSDPSANLHIAAFGFDIGDTAITFMHNDGSGAATKDAIGGQATLATANTGYIAYIFAYPNDTTIYYRIDDLTQGTTLVDSSATSDLPTNTTALGAVCLMSNGTANTSVGDATIGIESISVYTEN